MSHYDDNFGHWDDMDDPDMQDFYDHIQSTNVLKTCERCGLEVNIQPHYAYCNSCADAIESGFGG
jgi:hypothetical protein